MPIAALNAASSSVRPSSHRGGLLHSRGLDGKRCVHTGQKKPLSVYEVVENLNMAINAAVAISK